MVEDRVIAEQLTALLTPTPQISVRFFSRIRAERENLNTSIDGGCGLIIFIL